VVRKLGKKKKGKEGGRKVYLLDKKVSKAQLTCQKKGREVKYAIQIIRRERERERGRQDTNQATHIKNKNE